MFLILLLTLSLLVFTKEVIDFFPVPKGFFTALERVVVFHIELAL